MCITINKAIDSDIPDLVFLLGMLFARESEFTPHSIKQEKALKEIIARHEAGTIFVMRDEGHIVGMVSLLYTISTALGGKAAILEDMIILPGKQGMGYGTMLLRTCIAHAKKAGCLRIQLLTDSGNTEAIRFYRKQNFHESKMVTMRLIF